MMMDQQEKEALFLALQDSDVDLARVTEDLISLLVQKGIILFTELPSAVQAKLVDREKLREKLGQVNVSILSEGDTL
ncbi:MULTISPECIES: hypothetical protein [unclassified Oleiphilus]|uniref:hypothetical protein n=1 Tax=unclassified Oleiphilus TaxID=2631174 RepID=UPI000AA75FDA|nr:MULTISPECIES: hypothetical protein [unclassified Oleiphilus]